MAMTSKLLFRFARIALCIGLWSPSVFAESLPTRIRERCEQLLFKANSKADILLESGVARLLPGSRIDSKAREIVLRRMHGRVARFMGEGEPLRHHRQRALLFNSIELKAWPMILRRLSDFGITGEPVFSEAGLVGISVNPQSVGKKLAALLAALTSDYKFLYSPLTLRARGFAASVDPDNKILYLPSLFYRSETDLSLYTAVLHEVVHGELAARREVRKDHLYGVHFHFQPEIRAESTAHFDDYGKAFLSEEIVVRVAVVAYELTCAPYLRPDQLIMGSLEFGRLRRYLAGYLDWLVPLILSSNGPPPGITFTTIINSKSLHETLLLERKAFGELRQTIDQMYASSVTRFDPDFVMFDDFQKLSPYSGRLWSWLEEIGVNTSKYRPTPSQCRSFTE